MGDSEGVDHRSRRKEDGLVKRQIVISSDNISLWTNLLTHTNGILKWQIPIFGRHGKLERSFKSDYPDMVDVKRYWLFLLPLNSLLV